MRTAGFWPPLMLTRPTPLSWEILGARRVSTRSSTCESGMELEVTAKVSTGASAGVGFIEMGGRRGLGGGKHLVGVGSVCDYFSVASVVQVLVEVIGAKPRAAPLAGSHKLGTFH